MVPIEGVIILDDMPEVVCCTLQMMQKVGDGDVQPNHASNDGPARDDKNVSSEQGNARLEASVNKLRFKLQQKNNQEANLWKKFLAQKKELKALDKNKILKLENELFHGTLSRVYMSSRFG